MTLADLVQAPESSVEWRDAIWPRFETAMLVLISQACQLIQNDVRRSAGWRETSYTWALKGHLWKLAGRSPIPVFVEYDGAVLSDEDFAAGVSPDRALKIDLVLHLLHQPEPTVYFGVEAKILVIDGVASYTAASTVSDYVDEGIQRYVDGRYARMLPAAAMIGYVLTGATKDLVLRINERIRSRPVPCDVELAPHAGPVLPDHHASVHPRVQGGPIRLHHALITFQALASTTGRRARDTRAFRPSAAPRRRRRATFRRS